MWTTGTANLRFIDTAGLRKRGKVEDGVERYSVLRSLAAVERAKVCVIMIERHRGLYRAGF